VPREGTAAQAPAAEQKAASQGRSVLAHVAAERALEGQCAGRSANPSRWPKARSAASKLSKLNAEAKKIEVELA
jgi:hypothetical protein